MLHSNHYVYTQSQCTRPNGTPPHMSTHPARSHHELPPHPAAPTPRLKQLNPINTTLDVPNKQRHHSLSSSSEEAEDAHQTSNNGWQLIRRTKRKKLHSSQPAVQMSQTGTYNRYDILTQEVHQAEPGEQPQPPKNHKPPPIFIHGVINYSEMIKSISEVAEEEQYFTKSMANNVIKLTCTTPDTYRNLIKHFKEKGIYYHTYQLKEERAYRVVLKYLHHTTEVEDIRQELFALGHVARNIVNFHHSLTKETLNLFFIDLEPAINNKDI